MVGKRFPAATLAAFVLLCSAAGAADAPPNAPQIGADSNLPVPRMVSLRSAGANGRHGPGLEHRIDWIYQRPGLPLQVTGESGPWRRVRDPGGTEVWMHVQNLEARRTVFVLADAALRRDPREGAAVSAYVAPGVTAGLTGCDGDWRRVTVGGRVGWVSTDALWGAEDCAGL